jgi:hypothetical protein
VNFGFIAMCSDALRFVVMRSYHGFWGIFHGDNTGSNPVGDANKTIGLGETPNFVAGPKRSIKNFNLPLDPYQT